MPKPSAVRNSFDFLFPQTPGQEPVEGSLFLLDIGLIKPTVGQPRTQFPSRARAELSANIIELRERGMGVGGTGILQPLLVRSDSQGGYLITAGERRYWAARDAGNAQVPALIREQTESQAFEEALIENIQRHDLSGPELAHAYQRLMQEHGLSMRELARRVGKSASEISRTIAVSSSPLLAQAIERGEVTSSQAQEILPAPEPRQAQLIALVATRKHDGQPLSLPELRRHVRDTRAPAAPAVALRNTQASTPHEPGVQKRASGAGRELSQTPAPIEDEEDGATLARRLRQVTLQLQGLRDAAPELAHRNQAGGKAAALAELDKQDAAIKAIRIALEPGAAE